MDDKLDEGLLHSLAVGGAWSEEVGDTVHGEDAAYLGDLHQLLDEAASLEARHAVVPHPPQQLLHVGVRHKLTQGRKFHVP